MIIKKPKAQLPGHVQPISVRTEACWKNKKKMTIMTLKLLVQMMPGDFSQPDQNPSSQGTPEMVPSQDDHDQTEPHNDDDTPVLTEEEIAQLQEEDVDTEPYISDHTHFVDIDGTVFVPLGPKLTGAPDFGS